MTLTTASVLPDAAVPVSGPAVFAVVLTSGASGLRALLDAVAASAVRPERVVVLDTSAQAPDSEVAAVVASEQSPSFRVAHVPLDAGMPDRAAVARWLEAAELGEGAAVWLETRPGRTGLVVWADGRTTTIRR
jgi:hypothetical protein